MELSNEETAVLAALLHNYAGVRQVVDCIVAIMKNPDEYEHHRKLREYFAEYKSNNPYVDNYKKTFHRHMYVINIMNSKLWLNDRKKIHRTDVDERGRTLPAIICSNGDKRWCINGVNHRDELGIDGMVLPARVDANGTRMWFKEGKLHRTDRIMTKLANGKKIWQTLPAVEYANGDKYWYISGVLQRDDVDENGRALPCEIMDNGTMKWRQGGFLHRADLDDNGEVLPAAVYSNGTNIWYHEGNMYSKKDLTELLRKSQTSMSAEITLIDGKVIRLNHIQSFVCSAHK